MKFKKLLALIVTTLTAACIAVGFSGCEDDKPYPPKPKQQYFESFEDLKSYYETDFKKTNTEQFYLLTPEYEFFHKYMSGHTYYIKGENNSTDSFYKNPVIKEYFAGYSDELGTNSDISLDGEVRWSFKMGIEFLPLSKDYEKQNDFTFSFKQNDNPHLNWKGIIEVYDGETLIAECLYDENSDNITKEWLEDYLTKNLF